MTSTSAELNLIDENTVPSFSMHEIESDAGGPLKRVVSNDDLARSKVLAIRKEHFQRHKRLDPTEVLLSIMRYKKIHVCTKSYKHLSTFFDKPSQEDFEPMDLVVMKALRLGDVKELRKHAEGKKLRFRNKAGESLLHSACRRGQTEVVSFLVKEARLSLRICDDYGRTVMHDAFWTAQPNFGIVEILVKMCPDLLFVKDMRGHTPLRYAPKEHWKTWVKYLARNVYNIIPGSEFQTESI